MAPAFIPLRHAKLEAFVCAVPSAWNTFPQLFPWPVLPYLSSLSSNVTSLEGPSLTFLCKVAPFFTFCRNTMCFFHAFIML